MPDMPHPAIPPRPFAAGESAIVTPAMLESFRFAWRAANKAHDDLGAFRPLAPHLLEPAILAAMVAAPELNVAALAKAESERDAALVALDLSADMLAAMTEILEGMDTFTPAEFTAARVRFSATAVALRAAAENLPGRVAA